MLLLEEKERRAKRNKFRTQYYPDAGPYRRELYGKHLEFFVAGAEFNERALFGGNRSGKTLAGAYEMVCHLTGLYPAWWQGRRFADPVDAWTAGDTARSVRDIMQATLLGPPGSQADQGTGMLPGDLIVRTTPKHGLPDAIESVQVKHVTGGVSVLTFKSYDQGRELFQGTSQHVIHLDEECPLDIYTECLLRTMTVEGTLYLTATPLQGVTPLILEFMPSMRPGGAPIDGGTKHATLVSWDDVPHLSDEQKQTLLAGIPPWQRDARSKGVPQLGSGAIYQVPEAEFVVAPFALPVYWPRCSALDVGWNTTAAVWLALDRDTGTVYVYDELYRAKAEPAIIASAIKQRGVWIPGVIDPASRGRSQVDGRQLLALYRDEGLDIDPADNAVEAGIYAVWQRLSTGQLKVFSTCVNLLAEYRLYRRDEKGRVVKQNDHALDALRYGVMTGLDRAVVEPVTRPGTRRWCDWTPPPVFPG